jgi:DNA-binding MarR family transcriptional regulator
MNNPRTKTNNSSKLQGKPTRRQLVERLISGMMNMRQADRDAGHNGILQKHGLSSPQMPVVMLVAQAGQVSVKDIASRFNITSSAATQLVQTLIRHDILRKTIDTQDRRAVRIEFTPKGKRTFAALRLNMLGQIEKVFKPVPDRELTEMITTFEKVLGYIKQ